MYIHIYVYTPEPPPHAAGTTQGEPLADQPLAGAASGTAAG